VAAAAAAAASYILLPNVWLHVWPH
jgi:hypothetical protein